MRNHSLTDDQLMSNKKTNAMDDDVSVDELLSTTVEYVGSEEENAAAVKIQAGFRGHQVREELNRNTSSSSTVKPV